MVSAPHDQHEGGICRCEHNYNNCKPFFHRQYKIDQFDNAKTFDGKRGQKKPSLWPKSHVNWYSAPKEDCEPNDNDKSIQFY